MLVVNKVNVVLVYDTLLESRASVHIRKLMGASDISVDNLPRVARESGLSCMRTSSWIDLRLRRGIYRVYMICVVYVRTFKLLVTHILNFDSTLAVLSNDQLNISVLASAYPVFIYLAQSRFGRKVILRNTAFASGKNIPTTYSFIRKLFLNILSVACGLLSRPDHTGHDKVGTESAYVHKLSHRV